jgi:hypothetical protein
MAAQFYEKAEVHCGEQPDAAREEMTDKGRQFKA